MIFAGSNIKQIKISSLLFVESDLKASCTATSALLYFSTTQNAASTTCRVRYASDITKTKDTFSVRGSLVSSRALIQFFCKEFTAFACVAGRNNLRFLHLRQSSV